MWLGFVSFFERELNGVPGQIGHSLKKSDVVMEDDVSRHLISRPQAQASLTREMDCYSQHTYRNGVERYRKLAEKKR